MERVDFLYYFYKLDEWSILPSLIFLGVGAMTDFGPLDCEPEEFPSWSSSTVWYFCCILLALSAWDSTTRQQQQSLLSVEQMARHLSSLPVNWDRQHLMGPIAVAAYSYMSLVPIIQPPIMKLLTTKKET